MIAHMSVVCQDHRQTGNAPLSDPRFFIIRFNSKSEYESCLYQVNNYVGPCGETSGYMHVLGRGEFAQSKEELELFDSIYRSDIVLISILNDGGKTMSLISAEVVGHIVYNEHYQRFVGFPARERQVHIEIPSGNSTIEVFDFSGLRMGVEISSQQPKLDSSDGHLMAFF